MEPAAINVHSNLSSSSKDFSSAINSFPPPQATRDPTAPLGEAFRDKIYVDQTKNIKRAMSGVKGAEGDNESVDSTGSGGQKTIKIGEVKKKKGSKTMDGKVMTFSDS